MPFSLLPREQFDRLTDISPEFLLRRRICLLMLDFDNTVLPYTSNELTDEIRSWVAEMQAAGITLCVVSNSKKPRCLPFCEACGVGCIRAAKKPFAKGIRECLRKYGVPAENAALVGDQIYTDALGANGADVYSILVRPIHLHNFWLKARFAVEQPFRWMACRRQKE